MRKKTVKNMCSTIFWYLLYFLPIIFTIVQYFSFQSWTGEELIDFKHDFLNLFADNLAYFGVDEYSFIASVLIDCFPNFLQSGASTYVVFSFMDYFVSVYILHIAVDFILFIPKLCHKWLNYFTQSGDCE